MLLGIEAISEGKIAVNFSTSRDSNSVSSECFGEYFLKRKERETHGRNKEKRRFRDSTKKILIWEKY